MTRQDVREFQTLADLLLDMAATLETVGMNAGYQKLVDLEDLWGQVMVKAQGITTVRKTVYNAGQKAVDTGVMPGG